MLTAPELEMGWRHGGVSSRGSIPHSHTNLNLMSHTLRPPKGKIDHISFFIDKWEEMVRSQDGRKGGQSLTDEAKRT